MEDVKVKVLTAIADHEAVLVNFKLGVPQSETVRGRVWRFAQASHGASSEDC